MKVNLTKLIYNYKETIPIDNNLIFGESYYKNTDIKGISPVTVNGFIKATEENLYVLTLDIKGEMTLTCALTLEPVNYPFAFTINEILSDQTVEAENYIKIIDNSIDFRPIIWQNILMAVPLKVISSKAEKMKLKGNGWELIREDYKAKGGGEEDGSSSTESK